ncbi:MAG: FHA domain-containing protein [Deltaproteobacteria bacterium]|nr:FHA domain-containing protein [Deltaproteobacteria bacterium]MDQ3301482.1 FHA domain-containing protein [Myxococcota bacterium]
MRLALTSLATLAVALPQVALPQLASADDDETEKSSFNVVVDRVDLEPASIGGHRLRVFVSALSLQGQRLDLTDPKTIKTFAGTTELKVPYALGTYGALDVDTAIIVVVQATIEYAEVLPVIADALEQRVLAGLPEGRTVAAVLPYGETIGEAKLAPLKQARSKLTALQSDGTASEPALLDTLERALRVLKKAKTEPEGRTLRKLILVIGDGRDLSGDRERVTRLGQRAAKEGVRIHSFGYSPNDVRRPLLTLGELSKRSLGTFRWVRSGTATSWAPPFEQLREEIASQYVLTYFTDTDLAGKKLRVVTAGRADATSRNEVKIPPPTCVGEPCEAGYCSGTRCMAPRTETGRSVLGWIVLVVVIVIGVLGILGLIGYLMSRRQNAAITPPPGMPGDPTAPAPPARPKKQPKLKPAPHVPVVTALAAPPAVGTGPRLYIMTGPRAGQEIALRHGFMIGKQPGCDLVIDDGYTSSQHAQIGMDHFGNCRLYDSGSTNGTFVNGVRVTEYVLEHGTTVRVGSTDLRFLAQ